MGLGRAVQTHSHSHVIYSDDHGANWHIGGSVKAATTNECSVAELANGTLVMNSRNYIGRETHSVHRGISWLVPCAARWPALGALMPRSLSRVARKERCDRHRAATSFPLSCLPRRSGDGGDSWSSPLYLAKTLIDPIVSGSMTTDTFGDGGMLVFTNPSSRTKRVNLTAFSSIDGGLSWDLAVTIDNRSAATTYSSIVQLPNGSYVVQYGVGATHMHRCVDNSCNNEQTIFTFDDDRLAPISSRLAP